MENTDEVFILDTNIIQYLLSKSASIAFISFLTNLNKQGKNLSVSEYSIFELTRGAKIKMEEELISTFNNFKRYSVTAEVLTAASRIETLYKMEGIQCDKISDGDKIIAATSVLTNATLFTTNGRDFPWPYFIETSRVPIIYTEHNYSKSILISSFQPDNQYILKRFTERS